MREDIISGMQLFKDTDPDYYKYLESWVQWFGFDIFGQAYQAHKKGKKIRVHKPENSSDILEIQEVD